MVDIEDVAKDDVDAAIKVHKALRPGLLESAYQQCHAFELRQHGRKVLTEISLPLTYEGQVVETLLPIHEAQLMTYLKLSKRQIGFLLNWNVTLMKHVIKRVVMNLSSPTPYPKHFKSPAQVPGLHCFRSQRKYFNKTMSASTAG